MMAVFAFRYSLFAVRQKVIPTGRQFAEPVWRAEGSFGTTKVVP